VNLRSALENESSARCELSFAKFLAPLLHLGSCSPDGIRTRVAGLRSQSPRPLDDGAKIVAIKFFYCAGVPGLEPRLTEPESAGLPITPYPKILNFLGKDTRLIN
jgi:hypothetical protein